MHNFDSYANWKIEQALRIQQCLRFGKRLSDEFARSKASDSEKLAAGACSQSHMILAKWMLTFGICF
jgi:hypothetical protein